MFRISVVIPVLDEAGTIGAALDHLQWLRSQGHEIIVVDGFSCDRGADIAAPLCDRIVTAGSGRAVQMNAGARSASGDVLVFLHVDTALSPESVTALGAEIVSRNEFWGRFDVTLDASGVAFRVIEAMMNWRSRLSGIATGDQAMFVSRSLFERVGGFPPIALMEDVALSKRLRRLQRPRCLRQRVTTSARRWRNRGVFTTIATMWGLRAAYFFGMSPDRLRAVYERGGRPR